MQQLCNNTNANTKGPAYAGPIVFLTELSMCINVGATKFHFMPLYFKLVPLSYTGLEELFQTKHLTMSNLCQLVGRTMCSLDTAVVIARVSFKGKDANRHILIEDQTACNNIAHAAGIKVQIFPNSKRVEEWKIFLEE